VIDVGLLLTMIVAMALPALVARWWPLATFGEPVGFVDAAIVPALIGLGVGRVVAVAIDAPSSLGSLSDLLIIRSGVEFWPGVAAAMLAAAWSAHRSGRAPHDRLADLAPFALIGYAGYEVTCLVRDGCYGPASSVGLRPPGTSTSMLPIGVVVAIAVVAGAIVLQRQLRRRASWIVVTGGLSVVAGVRSLSAIWLPRIGDGPTRQHWSSIVVFAVAAVLFAAASVGLRSEGRRAETYRPTGSDGIVSDQRSRPGRSP
jgi:hypothetical protein